VTDRPEKKAPVEITPQDALPGSDAWADKTVEALKKQAALQGKATRPRQRANRDPLKKYNKQRGMLNKIRDA
jgi:hypothetical protein